MKKSIPLILFIIGFAIGCSSDNDSDVNQNDDGEVIFTDTDGDGVSDDTEQSDGTDPNDNCSFLLSSQDFSLTSTLWKTLDCDGDCKSNEEEINEGTNPTDANDYLGSGDSIVKVTTSNLNGNVFTNYLFDQNGSRLIGLLNGNDITTATYIYNENNQLTGVNYFDETQGYLIQALTFEYTGDQISSYTINGNETYYVVYNGNFIEVHDANEPPGLFRRRITLTPSSQQVVATEYYRHSYDDYIYTLRTFTYDGGNLIGTHSEGQGYDPDTGTYYDLTDYWPNASSFEYSDTVTNPLLDAYHKLVIPSMISEIGFISYLSTGSWALFSNDFCLHYILDLGYDQADYAWEVDCQQGNGNPIKSTQTYNLDNNTLVNFSYE
jgi:Bacterial TSP3 repeat